MFDLFGKSNKRKQIYSDLLQEARQRKEDLFPGDGLLTLATRLENLAKINEILKLGVDVNERGASQMTALHLATWQRKPDIVNLLLQHGADLEAIDEDKETPLYSAVSGLDDLPEPYRSRPLLPIVELLLQAGARPDSFSKLYITPARLTDNPDVRRRLLLAEKEYYATHPNATPVDADWRDLQYENEFLTQLASKNRSMGYHLPQTGPMVKQTADTDVLRRNRAGAENGDPQAQYNLGVHFAQGIGVPRNDTEAARWYLRAAQQGHVQAQSILGVMYLEGSGLPQDSSESLRWFERAAGQGDAEAQNNLGVFFANGIGVRPNHVEAYKWFTLALQSGASGASAALRQLQSMMPSESVRQAQQLAAKWKASHL